jgi:acetyl-CoA C-acetyltransferase
VGAFGGSLRGVPAAELATVVIRAVVERSGVDSEAIEDVVMAQSYPNAEAPCIGRWAALNAGLPEHIPGLQIDRRCGGGLQAVVTAAMMVQTGAADCVLAGGVESMSSVEHYTTDLRWGRRSGGSNLYDRLDRGRVRSQPEWRYGPISGMIETAENLARDYGISRQSSDEFAARSHQRAGAAWAAGRFDGEVVTVEVPQTRGESVVVSRDEGIRPESSAAVLAGLRTVQPEGTVTAGNAAQQNDAAAACLIVAEDALERLNLTPIAFLHSWAAVGCDPSRMGIGPVPATERVLGKAGLRLDQMDLVEVNEAFACQVLSVLKAWEWDDPDRLNVNGGGISLGHPIAATGVRILTTLLYELRLRGGRYGLETMCVGGGQGMAAVFEAAE